GPNGLRGDLSRTYFVGDRPDERHRDVYRHSYEYLIETCQLIRAGRSFGEVIEALPAVPERYQEALSSYVVFHGVGMSYSDRPRVDRRTSKGATLLRENEVLSVESYLGEKGSGIAVKLEQLI